MGKVCVSVCARVSACVCMSVHVWVCEAASASDSLLTMYSLDP